MVSSLTTGVCLSVIVAGIFCANPRAETKRAERSKRYFNELMTIVFEKLVKKNESLSDYLF
ncbi:MAG: hypothetical protein DYG98_11620 [Haliscomenobacteraceae bacterium CHB4]|nr:hypothetical protein [Haliscomenobacteraceae bacterium CHB4]